MSFLPQREKKNSHIIEHHDGRVEIKFEDEPPRFPIIKGNMSSREFMNSRPSTSSIRPKSHPNLNQTSSVRVSSVRLDHGVLDLHYEEERSSPPTQTEMEIGLAFRSKLNVIICEFKLDKIALQKEFSSEKHLKKVLPLI